MNLDAGGLLLLGTVAAIVILAVYMVAISVVQGWREAKRRGGGFVARCSGALLGAAIAVMIISSCLVFAFLISYASALEHLPQ